MKKINDAINQSINFLEQGGDILLLIVIVTCLMWILIIEKYLFIKKTYPNLESKIIKVWNERSDRSSWFALKKREQILSEASQLLSRRIDIIKAIVSICPLLGLMGTVSGMINVFDVMGHIGNSNTRLMASGISLATIPTMAGMVTALSGLYFGNIIESLTRKRKNQLKEKLKFTGSL